MYKKSNSALLRLSSYLKPYTAIVLGALITLGFGVAGEALLAPLMGRIIDSVIETTKGSPYSINQLNTDSLLILLIIIIAILGRIFQIYLTGIISQNIMRDLRIKALEHTQKFSLNYLLNTPKGSLLSKITSDIETINDFFNVFSNQILKNIALMTLSLILMLTLNLKLGLISLVTFLPIIILTEILRRVARKTYRKVRHQTSKVNSFLSEHITAISVVKIFNKEKWSENKFKENNKGLLESLLDEVKIFSIVKPLTHMLGSFSTTLLILFGGILFKIDPNWISAGTLFAFIQLSQQFYRPLIEIAENFGVIQSALAGSERVFNLLDNNSVIEDNGKILPTNKKIEGKIKVKNLSFAYKKDRPVLKNINFSINPGEKIAIVGLSGSGKSTIANLLTRLWDVEKDQIYIDNMDIKEIALQSLRQQIITVQQDIFLFSGTVKDNIKMGSNLTEEQVINAAKTVNAHNFIEKLPDNYNTKIIENGENLSTGQKQLITFARAIAHNPSVVILDEATSNIDSESEQLIQNAMRKLFKGRTSIIIAHRLSTIIDADRILVLSKGKIIEEGNHKNLIKKKGAYYNLYLLQHSGEINKENQINSHS